MRFICFLLSYFVTISVHAQIDPSSALLLRQGSRPATREGGLDSGRYTIRPSGRVVTGANPTSSENSRPGAQDSGPGEPRAEQHQPSSAPATQESDGDFLASGGTRPAVVSNPEPGSFLSGAGGPVETQSISETVLGGSKDELKTYEEMLNPEDRRRNILEISLAPSFIYNTSRSPYVFRDYTTSGPGVSADAKIWLSPFFGVSASYATTLSGSVSDSFASQKYVTATQSWTRAGLRSRTFLATGLYSPSLTFGVDYYDYQFRVPSEADNRGRLRTTGASLSLEGEWPTSAKYSWLIGFSLVPKATHKESSTDLVLHSGSKAETNGLSLSVGGRIQFDRRGALFFKLTHSLEKHVFSGDATTPDPRTGITPSGVPVLNSFSIFQLGYTWGS